MRRSSRSVCANLREAWAKRRYEAHFLSKLSDCDGENSETETWLDHVCTADVLFIDDLFKGKMTEAQELAAIGVFERRTNHLLPVIVTMNSTGRMILDRMTEQGRADRGEPLIRRMGEFCEVVKF